MGCEIFGIAIAMRLREEFFLLCLREKDPPYAVKII
jgi:hypothetical protein